jgi:hypothetical protein
MTVIVHVNPADLRGVPFDRYASVLGNLVGESYPWSGWEVLPGDRTEVVVLDSDGSVDADKVLKEVLKMARTITRPSYEAPFR